MNYPKHHKNHKNFGRPGTIRMEKYNYIINTTIKENGPTVEYNNIKIRLALDAKKHKVIIEGKRNKAINYMDNFLLQNIIAKSKNGISLLSNKLMLYGKNRPCKEICESLAAYFNIKTLIKPIELNPNVLCIVVADGIKPKTGVIFTTRTKWNVHSVDPLMQQEWTNGDYYKYFPNLKCHSKKIEEAWDSISSIENIKAIVVICVHAHVNINQLWKNLINKHSDLPILLLSIPCCKGFKQIKDQEPIIDLVDPALDSEDCGQVFVWTKNWTKDTTKTNETNEAIEKKEAIDTIVITEVTEVTEVTESTEATE